MFIYRSPLPEVEIPGTALGSYVFGRDDFGDRPALIDGDSGLSISFRTLRDSVYALAGGLAARGFAAGDVLALLAPTIPEYAIVFHAAGVAGGAVTTVNPNYSVREIHHQLGHSQARSLVTTAASLPIARQASAGTKIREVLTVERCGEASSISDLFAAPLAQAAIDPADHVVALPYSSGTTGLPKGVMLTHRNLVANIAQCLHALPHHPGDVALAVLPFFHIYGMQLLMNAPIVAGCTVVTMRRFDLARALRLIEERRVTRFLVVPPIVHALATDPIVRDFDLSSLRLVNSGAAPLGEAIAARASERIGCTIVQGFGMTELSPVSHATPPGRMQPGSVGVTVSNAECRIVADGIDQPPGCDGELWVRGPGVMKGYLNDRAATEATIDGDGWLHTGDIGRFDEDGYLYIVDRMKDLIKVNGFQVAPAELEAALLTHPAIKDAAVVGVPDAASGEVPKAFVVRSPNAPGVTADEVMNHLVGHLATYKRVRAVEFVDAIPHSASGKVLRRALRGPT